MRNTIACLLIGTLVSFAFNYYLVGNAEFSITLYNAFAFGLGWAMAYFVDRPSWPLSKKLGLSLLGIGLLVVIGFIFFDFEVAVPSVIKFSTVFVAYYLIASFRSSKSLRN